MKATDTDLSPQVVGDRAGEGGRHHHLRCAAPDRLARGRGHSRQLDVPIATNSPGFAPHLLETPAGEGLVTLDNVTSFVPNDAEMPAAQKLADAYKKKLPEGVALVDYGYGAAQVFGEILKRPAPTETSPEPDSRRRCDSSGTSSRVGSSFRSTTPRRGGRAHVRPASAARTRAWRGGLKILKPPFASDAAKA
jgi:hypothetical protein